MELNDKWIIWSHGLNNTNWNIDSYNKLFELSDIEKSEN